MKRCMQFTTRQPFQTFRHISHFNGMELMLAFNIIRLILILTNLFSSFLFNSICDGTILRLRNEEWRMVMDGDVLCDFGTSKRFGTSI